MNFAKLANKILNYLYAIHLNFNGAHKSYFTLASGKRFYPFNPKPEDIDIKDIALALSHVCRFGGHSFTHYSVAQHSVNCSYLVPSKHALAALMHDATEAYVGDMIQPIKRWNRPFRFMEDRVWSAICAKFSIELELPACVKHADLYSLAMEARDLLVPFGKEKEGFISDLPPDPRIIPWDAKDAEIKFLNRYYELVAIRDRSKAKLANFSFAVQ